MATDLLAVDISNLFHGCAIRRTTICDDDLRIAVSFHCFVQEFQCSSLVASLGDIAFQYFAFVVDGAPEIMLDAIDFDEDFIEMPLPLCDPAHVVSTWFTDLLCEVSSEAINP